MIDAIKSGDLTYSNSNGFLFGGSGKNVAGASFEIKSTGKDILKLEGFVPGSTDRETIKISISDDNRTMTISWTTRNSKAVSDEAVILNAVEHGYTLFELRFWLGQRACDSGTE